MSVAHGSPGSASEDKNKEKNFVADNQNWEQRVKSELESAQKWNENWGVLFSRGIPNDYEKRIQYLDQELKKHDTLSGTMNRPRYGLNGGRGFAEVARVDYRRKKDVDSRFDDL